MARVITCDLDSPDYTNALLALEWAISNARRLGYSPPTNFDVAVRLMKGELRVPMMSDNGEEGCFGIISSGDNSDFDNNMEIFQFWFGQTARRTDRGKAAQAVAEIASVAMSLPAPEPANGGLTCSKCGGPRSVGSASQCRACYIVTLIKDEEPAA